MTGRANPMPGHRGGDPAGKLSVALRFFSGSSFRTKERSKYLQVCRIGNKSAMIDGLPLHPASPRFPDPRVATHRGSFTGGHSRQTGTDRKGTSSPLPVRRREDSRYEPDRKELT